MRVTIFRYILNETGSDTGFGIHLFEVLRAFVTVVIQASFEVLTALLL
jgi:hypothetical protein